MDIDNQINGNSSNILVLTYWSFSDALIQTYTLPYLKMIRKVVPSRSKIILFTLEKGGQERIKPGFSNDCEGIECLSASYRPFGWKAFRFWAIEGMKLFRLIRRHRISFIHCMGTPPGAIGYVLSRLSGSKLVLDSYEPHAEAMVENGTWSKNSMAFRLLFWLEKKQTEHAAFFISATAGMKQYALMKYGITPAKFFTKPAGVNLDVFHLGQVKMPSAMAALGLEMNHIVGVYAGKFGGIYLDQEVFDLFAVAEKYWGDRFRILLLTNTSKVDIDRYSRKSGLDPNKIIIKFVSHHEVPAFIGVGDFAITPVKPVPTKRYCTPIKNGEYWALGLPVIIPANISDDSDIIERNDIGAVLYELNQTAYLKAIKKIDELMKQPGLRNTIRKVASQHRSFGSAEKIYSEIYS